MRLLLAIIVGKLIASLSRLLKIGGGSAAPGLYALKIYPQLVESLCKRIPIHVVITGTNGKTTTARILAHLANEAGLKVIRNSTGSNLERGVASALIADQHSVNLGIWELDEAAFNSVTLKITPQVVVFLNVFRDQLDRYGEVDNVVKNWCQTLKKLNPQTVVLVNGDDVKTAQLKSCFKGQVETFGVEDFKIVGESIEKSAHHKLDFEAQNVRLNGLNGTTFQLLIDNSKLLIHLPVPGIYHVYDAVAALSCAYHLQLPIRRLTDSLKNFQPAFGRVEKLPFGYIFLIKNPAGATQVFETLAPQMKKNDRLLLALNDNLADGTDVSWIWDGDFEKLSVNSFQLSVTCSGTRAEDLAVRLKYAGFEPRHIMVESDLKKALGASRKGLKGQLYILPTYTAMLKLQKILSEEGLKKPYWEETSN